MNRFKHILLYKHTNCLWILEFTFPLFSILYPYEYLSKQIMINSSKIICVCSFVCLEIFVPLQNFSFSWRHHHCRWRAAKIWPMLGTYGYWVRVRVLQLATHTVTRVSVYNDYIRQKIILFFAPLRSQNRLSRGLRRTWRRSAKLKLVAIVRYTENGQSQQFSHEKQDQSHRR